MFFVACRWTWKQKPQKFLRKNFRTWRWPSIVIWRSLGSPLCASFAAQWTFDTPCKSTNKSSSWFSPEAMTKGYQAYRDSWTTVLSEEMPCLREVGNRVDFPLTWRLGREVWPSKVWSIATSCLREKKKKLKIFFLKQTQHFHETLHPKNFPAIRY